MILSILMRLLTIYDKKILQYLVSLPPFLETVTIWRGLEIKISYRLIWIHLNSTSAQIPCIIRRLQLHRTRHTRRHLGSYIFRTLRCGKPTSTTCSISICVYQRWECKPGLRFLISARYSYASQHQTAIECPSIRNKQMLHPH